MSEILVLDHLSSSEILEHARDQIIVFKFGGLVGSLQILRCRQTQMLENKNIRRNWNPGVNDKSHPHSRI